LGREERSFLIASLENPQRCVNTLDIVLLASVRDFLSFLERFVYKNKFMWKIKIPLRVKTFSLAGSQREHLDQRCFITQGGDVRSVFCKNFKEF
jgi:hypothetical protein